jgi:(E)-4-hydroxy-3-methyl-but-2-enyl pyrophosphate reductase
MKVVIAKNAGFCMGVRRAVELALDTAGKHHCPIYTYGPLIHNPQVLALFAEKGITVLDTIPEHGNGTVLVRAHGVPPTTKQALKKAGFSVIDATCPRVVKVQSIIKKHARKGQAVIIVGDEDHPEVIGLLGFAEGNGYVVGSLEELAQLPPFAQAIIVAQTTQNQKLYQDIKTWTAEQRPHYTVFETICDSTEKRQAEIREMSRLVDAMLVVGGKNSGNTRRLAEIASAEGKPVYHVETEAELDADALAQVNILGITAGASTPSWVIKRVLSAVEQIPLRRWQGWRSFVAAGQRLLLLTNIYVALGAGSLCYAANRIQGMQVINSALAAAFLYVVSMHILNHLTGRAENHYNDPERAKFYGRYKVTLTSMALIAGALGGVAAFQMGYVAFWSLLAMSLLGLSYNVRLIPAGLTRGRRIQRIRDIPGSKTILIALAWGVVTTGLPSLANPLYHPISTMLAFIVAAGLVFVRTAFFDILDVQGDRIVGKETIPILLGAQRTFTLLKRLLVFILVLLTTAGALGFLKPAVYAMAICPALLFLVVSRYQRGNMLPGIRMEFLVESILVLSGLLVFGYEALWGA